MAHDNLKYGDIATPDNIQIYTVTTVPKSILIRDLVVVKKGPYLTKRYSENARVTGSSGNVI